MQQQRLTELNHPDHPLITYPGLGHQLSPAIGYFVPGSVVPGSGMLIIMLQGSYFIHYFASLNSPQLVIVSLYHLLTFFTIIRCCNAFVMTASTLILYFTMVVWVLVAIPFTFLKLTDIMIHHKHSLPN
jgi:hypothetical protein